MNQMILKTVDKSDAAAHWRDIVKPLDALLERLEMWCWLDTKVDRALQYDTDTESTFLQCMQHSICHASHTVQHGNFDASALWFAPVPQPCNSPHLPERWAHMVKRVDANARQLIETLRDGWPLALRMHNAREQKRKFWAKDDKPKRKNAEQVLHRAETELYYYTQDPRLLAAYRLMDSGQTSHTDCAVLQEIIAVIGDQIYRAAKPNRVPA
ncbi:MAG: hypothetical protein AAF607_03845 [Pseudomonadota bacterium]